ncbi:CBS domain-containing protein [Natronococcus sp. A-GB7]|uniref:CBS domain-containing protein n=1 Tax=Natronococcus sp. A-GB7 TaxID=3037649 RepID=UPI00241E0154|nr:CBS domain-containing protein [Natronococcus sp. A-GB7]MDG5821643.1 CBS domain-containing protein [Natronococcus sp. A-GB7]
MQFYTAGDVLQQEKGVDLTDPITIEPTTTIKEALSVMFRHDFTQLPVVVSGTVSGVVTFKSISRMLKSTPESSIINNSVRGALVQPRYVNEGHDIFELFDTFAEDEYVLVGNENDLRGIMTRYDMFYFLQSQFEPFIKIGEIEQSVRSIFRSSIDDIEGKIKDTFGPREENDPSYSMPTSIDHFNFEEYKRFIRKNISDLPIQIKKEIDFVIDLLEQVRKSRNALFHFRAGISEIDREAIDVAHSYFTTLDTNSNK